MIEVKEWARQYTEALDVDYSQRKEKLRAAPVFLIIDEEPTALCTAWLSPEEILAAN